MKKLLIFFCILCYSSGFSQNKIYKYYLYLSDYSSAPVFTNVSGNLVYSGQNNFERVFFSGKNLKVFEPAFPDGIDVAVKNVFYIETTNSTLVDDMRRTFPSLYWKSDDITDIVYESLTDFYPNDYGTSSPNPNFGFNFNRKEWDYLHVPKAWGITTGNSDIKIGISDGAIKGNDPDFLNKVELVDGFYFTTSNTSHGTDVAAIAAARGNNSYGSAGVCMECSIVSGTHELDIDGPGPNITYTNLYKMAKKGAKVINMSWHNSGYRNMDVNSQYYYNPGNIFPILAEQLVINDLVNQYRVTLVAAAGNHPSFGTPSSNVYGVPYGIISMFPASYDNVISVSNICHTNEVTLPFSQNQSAYCCTSSLYPIYIKVEDSFSIFVSGADPNNPIGVNRSGYQDSPTANLDGFARNLTINPKVDILAPGWDVYNHNNNLAIPAVDYGVGIGTSFSAPTVSGTIGLMLSLNNCLYPSEIEAILKLTTKDIEVLPLNQNFVGNVGSGKLEVGDAVEFTNEMKKVDGNAVIDNHIFNRFDFNLSKINNKLSISNVTFENDCKANFEARNQIHLLPGTNLKPNTVGNTHLSINPSIDISCTPVVFPRSSNNSTVSKNEALNKVVLSPNPNNGSFRLLNINYNDFGKQPIQLEIFDINGRNLYKKVLNEDDIINCEVNLNDLTSGIYFVKLSSSIRTVGIKFMKN